MNIMIAGRDTTAATLTFLIYLLAMHPDVMKRLRDEILEQVGSTRRPDYDDIRDMKYLRAVINGMSQSSLTTKRAEERHTRNVEAIPHCVSLYLMKSVPYSSNFIDIQALQHSVRFSTPITALRLTFKE
jgi:hypothetical protein